MSMLAAPVVEGLAAKTAAGTAGKAAASKAAGKSATTTAAARAAQLRKSGGTRHGQVRALADEYGATHDQAGDLLDAAPTPAPVTPAPTPPAPITPSPKGSRAPSSIASSGGGAILAVIAYVIGMTYMRGGSDGVKAWFRAKFLNEVS